MKRPRVRFAFLLPVLFAGAWLALPAKAAGQTGPDTTAIVYKVDIKNEHCRPPVAKCQEEFCRGRLSECRLHADSYEHIRRTG